ncbi:MAG: nuclear transport factor 2 family protein [Gemmatimonadaceae bacterium]|nr:nuclear transport factor 2 family protein [Gemmatimonadaceae bacterium]
MESSVAERELDAVLATLYGAVSGPAGAARDWTALASLFHPSARLLCLDAGVDGYDGAAMTLDDYRRTRSPFFDSTDFHETEFRRETHLQGPLALVYSWYAGRRRPGGEDLVRGVNAIQLCRQRGRWVILSVAWYRDHDAVGPLPRAHE